MKNPWTVLIDALEGEHSATPDFWPARRVHRMSDDTAPLRPQPKSPPRPGHEPPMRATSERPGPGRSRG